VAIGEMGKVLRHIQFAFEDGTVTGLTDRELVERFAASGPPGGEVAFAALVRRHGPMVLRVCRGVLRNHQDAQDAFQATFLILARKAGSVWVRDSVGPWLYGVACRVAACSKAAAARRRRHERRAAAMTVPYSVVREAGHDDLQAILHEELGRLPEKYRAAIVLYDLEGETYESVARHLGCPVGTVKSRLARGRALLRNRIVRRGAGPSLGALAGVLSGRTADSAVSSALIDATTRLAAGLSTGYTATKVIPAAIVGLMEGVLKMMFWSKLKVVAASVALGCGLFSVSVLCFGPGLRADGPLTVQGATEATRDEQPPISASVLQSAPAPEEPDMLPAQPRPWETVVRMRIPGEHGVGMGSGTIIHSTPGESIVLTAAHFFHRGREGAAIKGVEPAPLAVPENAGVTTALDEPPFTNEDYRQVFARRRKDNSAPSKLSFKIIIDLFDGKLTGSPSAQVHFLESVAGELVDCDFDRDVALVRIRPGRRLPASRIVPARWKSQVGMQMLTVGCSEGRDATAWHTTITNPQFHDISGKPEYEAIECRTAPKQGRTGGGLFTDDGFVAGVCNYAEPKGNHGLYAAPGSIYQLLDRNELTFVYGNAEVAKHELDDQIGALDARIQQDMLKLQRLKELHRQAAESRSRVSEPSPVPAIGLELTALPPVEPTTGGSAPPDHERRLRDVERKLDRVLKLLEGAEDKPKPAR
jgi:RNA polymerase sigma factor (sigma-70 family)